MTSHTELAKDPQAFDTKLAELHTQLDKARRTLAARISDMHKAVGDRRRTTRHGVAWTMSFEQAHYAALAKHLDAELAAISSARFDITDIELDIQAMDEAYTGWTRFFPSVTKSQPHIHRSLTCRTLHATTVMSWAPGLSGKSDEQAVAELDEALCSVCFPDAPVALHEYVSRRSQAERTEREVAKMLRDERKAQAQLTEAEQFKTTGRFGERVTTVAKCRELVRKAIELEVELEYWTTHSPENWTADLLANRRRNLADSLSEARVDAAEAERVLLAREARHEGYGDTAEAIVRMQDRKRQSATKEWAKV